MKNLLKKVNKNYFKVDKKFPMNSNKFILTNAFKKNIGYKNMTFAKYNIRSHHTEIKHEKEVDLSGKSTYKKVVYLKSINIDKYPSNLNRKMLFKNINANSIFNEFKLFGCKDEKIIFTIKFNEHYYVNDDDFYDFLNSFCVKLGFPIGSSINNIYYGNTLHIPIGVNDKFDMFEVLHIIDEIDPILQNKAMINDINSFFNNDELMFDNIEYKIEYDNLFQQLTCSNTNKKALFQKLEIIKLYDDMVTFTISHNIEGKLTSNGTYDYDIFDILMNDLSKLINNNGCWANIARSNFILIVSKLNINKILKYMHHWEPLLYNQTLITKICETFDILPLLESEIISIKNNKALTKYDLLKRAKQSCILFNSNNSSLFKSIEFNSEKSLLDVLINPNFFSNEKIKDIFTKTLIDRFGYSNVIQCDDKFRLEVQISDLKKINKILEIICEFEPIMPIIMRKHFYDVASNKTQ